MTLPRWQIRFLAAVTALVLPLAGCGKVYKVNSLELAVKQASDPFQIRDKVVGKTIETQMIVENFVDEGSDAKLIDALDGFFCRMKPSEFEKHNDRGVLVVRGTLVQDGGEIGLDHCEFVSNDANWKATSTYNDLVR